MNLLNELCPTCKGAKVLTNPLNLSGVGVASEGLMKTSACNDSSIKSLCVVIDVNSVSVTPSVETTKLTLPLKP